MKKIKTQTEVYINLSTRELISETLKVFDEDGNVVKSETTWHDHEEETEMADFSDEIDAMFEDDEDEVLDVHLSQRKDGDGKTIEFSLDEGGEEIIHKVFSPDGLVLFKADLHEGQDQYFQYDSDGRLTDMYKLYGFHEHHEYKKSGNSEIEIIINTDLEKIYDFEDDVVSFDDYYSSVVESKTWKDGVIYKRKEIRHTRGNHSIIIETIETEFLKQGTEEDRSLMIDDLDMLGRTFQRRIYDYRNGKACNQSTLNFDSSGRLVESFSKAESGSSVHMINLYSEDGNLEKAISVTYDPQNIYQVETRVSSFQYTYY